MTNTCCIAVCVLAFLFPRTLYAQSPSTAKPEASEKGIARHLTVVQTTKTPETASTITVPVRCDDHGNLYARTEPSGVASIRKLTPKGELAALFQPSSVTDLKVNLSLQFDLDGSGGEYQLALGEKPPLRVITFKSDGSYENSIKLDTGLLFPAALAVFRPSNTFLITGQKYDQSRIAVKVPFTGIFSSSGVLLKEISLEDDKAIHDMAGAGDPRAINPEAPTDNQIVSLSQMQAADDGNIYLMRWLSPAILYAVSPGGEVVRRFEVKLSDNNYRPDTMHISGNRLAVLFVHPQTQRQIMKVVDLEGHEVESYEIGHAGNADLGGGFACYTSNPEQFTFLAAGDNDQLEIKIAEPR